MGPVLLYVMTVIALFLVSMLVMLGTSKNRW